MGKPRLIELIFFPRTLNWKLVGLEFKPESV